MKEKNEDYYEDWFTVEKCKSYMIPLCFPISAPSMSEKRSLLELDPLHSQVKKGRPEEHKRRDSQPLPPAIGSTSFGSSTTGFYV